MVNVTKEANTKDDEHRDWRDRVASMQRRECAVRWRGGQNTGWWSQQGRLWLNRQVAICSGIRTDLGAGVRNSGHIRLQGGIYCQESDLSDIRLQDKDATRPKEELGLRTRSPTSGLSLLPPFILSLSYSWISPLFWFTWQKTWPVTASELLHAAGIQREIDRVSVPSQNV